jgi:hypothetical protein
MLFWTFQITIISIILIFLVHYLINFFKDTLTVPRIKDLVNVPAKKYENMFNVISNNNTSEEILNEYTIRDLLPSTDINEMKNELKSFFKKQLDINKNSTDISSLEKSYYD